jgi:AAA domain
VVSSPSRASSTVSESSRANLLILTGSPASGKTAILSRLKGEFGCVDEPAREVLAEQRATGGRGTWYQAHRRSCLQRSIEQYVVARRSDETVIFDRGIPDCVVTPSGPGRTPRRALQPSTRLGNAAAHPVASLEDGFHRR